MGRYTTPRVNMRFSKVRVTEFFFEVIRNFFTVELASIYKQENKEKYFSNLIQQFSS